MGQPMHCTVKEHHSRGVLIETHRIKDGAPSQLSGYMWLADSDLPEHLRATGSRFELTFMPHVNGTYSTHIVPLGTPLSPTLSAERRASLSTSHSTYIGEVVWLTLITMLCAQTLIELGITRHEEQHGPWVLMSWALTLLVVVCLRWV